MTSTFTTIEEAYDPTGLAAPLYSIVTFSTAGRVWSDVSAEIVQASTVSAQNWVGLPASPPGSGNSLFWTSRISAQVTGSNVTLDLPATGVTPASSYNSITVDDYGRITNAQVVSGSGGLPSMSQCSLSADTGRGSLTLADINSSMSLALTAGKLYRFLAHLVFRTQATTTGLRMGLTCPTFTILGATGRLPIAAGGPAGEYHSFITASGVSVTGTGVALAGVDYLAEIDGTIQPSASGNLVFQYASEINASRVTVRAGSNAILWQLT